MLYWELYKGFGWWLIYWDCLVVVYFSRFLAVLSEEDTHIFGTIKNVIHFVG